jgi:hypothetical protein
MKNGTARLQRVCSPEGTIQTKLPAWHQNNPNRSCRLWHKSKTEYGGKTMKKLCHRVSIFLAFLLLLTIVVGIAATAHARACNHVYEEPDVVIEYFYRSTTQHTRRTTTTKVCTKCGHIDETIEVDYLPHSIYLYDAGHNFAAHTHSYEWRCDNCLWVQRTSTIECEGPPCIAPYSLEPIPELQ